MDRPAILVRWAALTCLFATTASTPVLQAQVSDTPLPRTRSTTAPATPSQRTTPPTAVSTPKPNEYEDFALGIPSPENARKWLRLMTNEPHVAGTKADHDTALALRDLLQSWGWAVQIVEYEVLLNYPKTGAEGPVLELIKPDTRSLKVIEDPHPLDKDSANSAAFPAFHGYGVSGDVRGQVVYANYGRPEDFEALDKMGVSVKGKIVLTRYGEIFRGLKVRNAQKRGAIGILIFSDPMDDGYMRGDVYPHGPFRPASALQRGSVQFLSMGPGDPSTPGTPSLKGAKRLPIDERHGFTMLDAIERPTQRPRTIQSTPIDPKTLTIAEWEKISGLKREDYFATIPSLPISYESARPILEALGGGVAPAGFQGGLPLTYHTGPGPAEVHFKVEMDYAVRPIWNVVATLKGSVEPERWVMVGNHRDAWVYGAADPSSGTAATLEMCRALAAAVKKGWKPRRTIVYASWDAEEYGLVGSTEWADEHSKEITEKAVLMLNVDTAVSGPEFDIDGVPSLRDFLLDAAAKVTDVKTGKSLKDVWLAKQRARWAAAGPIDTLDNIWTSETLASKTREDASSFQPQLNPLGSGSDYTAFLDNLGVPAIDVGFSGRYGVYHAIYDNFFWMEKFGDPEFVYHASAARIYTLLAMRAASSEVVPMRFTPYAEALRETVDDYRRAIARKARGSEPGATPFAFSNLNRLVGSVKEFQLRAREADDAATQLSTQEVKPERLARFNDALMNVERSFLLREGLPGRPWFRHAIYAPGLTTGYAAWVFPGLKQGLQDNDADLFSQQVIALAQRIDAASDSLKTAARIAKEPDSRPDADAGKPEDDLRLPPDIKTP